MSRHSSESKSHSAHDNPGFESDSFSIPVEPAPHQFLPRIRTGSDVDKQTLPIDNNVNSEGQDDDDGEDRATWDNPIEFLLSCISMSVGLGNVWRFPGVAVRNGGGAFLIPYLIVLVFIGRPLYYLEMCLGQFSRYGQVKAWNCAPILKGVGYGALTACVAQATYYVMLMAVTVHYFFSSFAKDLPWAVCKEDKLPPGLFCNDSDPTNNSYYYYQYTVFPQHENLNDGLGTLHWQLALCLVFAWLLICLALIRGVQSSGKVAYFTAIFPYVVLTILLIRGVTLKGAWNGIKIFLEPKWSELGNPKVWYAAVSQCFFSLTAGFGPIIMFSSYNNFRQNIYKDAIIISFMDTFTSLLAGITIFAVIGNLMEDGLDIKDIQGGPGLAFVLYPRAIAQFGWAPQLFAVLFFLMLFTLGIGSASSLAGSVITIICDQFKTWKRWLVTVIVCSLGCAGGLMYVTQGGMLMLDLIDHYGSGFIVYVMAMIETAGISYVYGLNNFCNDIEFMVGRRPGIYWKICWAIILPFGLLGNLLYFLISEPTFTADGVEYPISATIAGWLLTGFAAGLVPAWAIHSVLTRKAPGLYEKFLNALKPTHRWGPQKPKLRREWEEFCQEKNKERGNRFFLF